VWTKKEGNWPKKKKNTSLNQISGTQKEKIPGKILLGGGGCGDFRGGSGPAISFKKKLSGEDSRGRRGGEIG